MTGESRQENLARMLAWKAMSPPSTPIEDEFVPGCTGKVRHTTKGAAQFGASASDKEGGRLVPYFCRHCQGWHAGSQPRKRRRIKMRR